jgi:hypothetical protein
MRPRRSGRTAMDPVPVFELFRSIAPSIQGASHPLLTAQTLAHHRCSCPLSSCPGRAASAAGQAARSGRHARRRCALAFCRAYPRLERGAANPCHTSTILRHAEWDRYLILLRPSRAWVSMRDKCGGRQSRAESGLSCLCVPAPTWPAPSRVPHTHAPAPPPRSYLASQ